jgi:hypothetical protein
MAYKQKTKKRKVRIEGFAQDFAKGFSSHVKKR